MGYRQNLRPRPSQTHGMDTVDTTVAIMDTLIATVTDTTEENDLLMPNQKQMLKPNHGTHMVTVHTHMLTLDTDTDTHILITTLERDLLMPNQKLKANHGTDMDTEVMDMDIILMDTDTVVTTMDKPYSFIEPRLPSTMFKSIRLFPNILMFLQISKLL